MLTALTVALAAGALLSGTAALTLNRREHTADARHRRGDTER